MTTTQRTDHGTTTVTDAARAEYRRALATGDYVPEVDDHHGPDRADLLTDDQLERDALAGMLEFERLARQPGWTAKDRDDLLEIANDYRRDLNAHRLARR